MNLHYYSLESLINAENKDDEVGRLISLSSLLQKAHPALFEGEGRGKKDCGTLFPANPNILLFYYENSQPTQTYYFTAKIMLKYCSEEY